MCLLWFECQWRLLVFEYFAANEADARSIYVGNVSRVFVNAAFHCRPLLAQVDYTTESAELEKLFRSDPVDPHCVLVAYHNCMHATCAFSLPFFNCDPSPIAVHAAPSLASPSPSTT
jgi:hypothetical protein